MKDLHDYLSENTQIDEGLLKPAIGLAMVRRMDPEYLLNGILDMYEYILDKSDIKLFYNDFPIKERIFWESIYKSYENKLWSIFDIEKNKFGNNENDSWIDECFPESNELVNVTPEFRRQLRNIINSSSSKNTELKASDINKIMLVDDPQFDKKYIFTTNKIIGGVRKIFNFTDVKFIEKVFEKISEI